MIATKMSRSHTQPNRNDLLYHDNSLKLICHIMNCGRGMSMRMTLTRFRLCRHPRRHRTEEQSDIFHNKLMNLYKLVMKAYQTQV